MAETKQELLRRLLVRLSRMERMVKLDAPNVILRDGALLICKGVAELQAIDGLVPTPEDVERHPHRHSQMRRDIEAVLLKRSLEKNLEGETLAVSLEVIDAIEHYMERDLVQWLCQSVLTREQIDDAVMPDEVGGLSLREYVDAHFGKSR